MALDVRVEGSGTSRHHKVPGVAEAVLRRMSDAAGEALRGGGVRELLLGSAGLFNAVAARLDAPGMDAGALQLAAARGSKAPTANAPVNVGGATYETGPDRRPNIRHDNGFLQNLQDPADPVPRPTQAPTPADGWYHLRELTQAEGGKALSNVPYAERLDSRLGLDNALPAYVHFLRGNGTDRTFDYDSFLKNDPSGTIIKQNIQSDVRAAGDRLYGNLDTQMPQQAGSSVRFQMRSDAITVGSDPSYPYPGTEDWQKAIGGHAIWTGSEVTVTRLADGRLLAEAKIKLHAEDRYNFNPDQHDIATGAPDALRGRLEEVGLARQYTQTGRSELTTRWIIGDPGPAEIRNGTGIPR